MGSAWTFAARVKARITMWRMDFMGWKDRGVNRLRGVIADPCEDEGFFHLSLNGGRQVRPSV